MSVFPSWPANYFERRLWHSSASRLLYGPMTLHFNQTMKVLETDVSIDTAGPSATGAGADPSMGAKEPRGRPQSKVDSPGTKLRFC